MFKKKGLVPLEATVNSYQVSSIKHPASRSGFTLIELMVVIAIIAVLAAVVTPQVFRQVEKGRIASVEAFYNTVKVAATAYFSDMGAWPSPGWCIGTNPYGSPNCNLLNPGFVTGPTGTNWDGPYLERWPNALTNPWTLDTWWQNNDGGAGVSFGPAASERAIWVGIPTQAAQRIDQHLDGALGSNTGKVRQQGNPAAWPATGNAFMGILVSRDGAVN